MLGFGKKMAVGCGGITNFLGNVAVKSTTIPFTTR